MDLAILCRFYSWGRKDTNDNSKINHKLSTLKVLQGLQIFLIKLFVQ